jgi:hypothetical protein
MNYILRCGFVLSVLTAVSVSAQEAAHNGGLACEAEQEFLTPTRYLRALTFDLAGRAPSNAELDNVLATGAVSEALIEELLSDPAFAAQAARLHKSFLWNNLSTVRLTNANFRLQRSGQLYWRRNPARNYRGDNIPCIDEPAQFDQNGGILPISGTQEGYVLVQPYWLPEGQTIKVCAYDAQTRLESPSGVRCSTRAASNEALCGCGANLRWCAINSANDAITNAMSEAMERFILSVFERNEPYSALFDSRRGFMNGPLSFFYQNWLDIPAGLSYRPLGLDMTQTPILTFNEADNWTEYLLPESHAGILTRPAFLLRFQTNRARANRFYDAFLCNGFQAPDTGIVAVADTGDQLNPDLQERTGCDYCHARLEPAAAHWGRWTEQGIGFLSEESFPPTREDCVRCAQTGQGCNAECRNFYHTNQLSTEDQPYLGQLNVYRFLKETAFEHVEQGPKRLAYTEIEGNQLTSCVAKRTAEWLLGRPLTPKESDWRDTLSKTFIWSDLNYRTLVKSVVTSDVYRRVR